MLISDFFMENQLVNSAIIDLSHVLIVIFTSYKEQYDVTNVTIKAHLSLFVNIEVVFKMHFCFQATYYLVVLCIGSNLWLKFDLERPSTLALTDFFQLTL